jgi:ornithine carbamoyltransferase
LSIIDYDIFYRESLPVENNPINSTPFDIFISAFNASDRVKEVFDKINSMVGARYKWLDDNSRNARYKTYKIRPDMAEKARTYLKYIYDHCYPTTE